MSKKIMFSGERATIDDFIASLKSDHVLVAIEADGDRYYFNVKSIAKMSGYFDFWRIDGYVGMATPAKLFIDYHEPEAAGYPKGGFGYLEV